MTDTQQALIRSLIAAQVAVIEWGEEDVKDDGPAIDALDKCLKEANRLARRLRKES